MPKCVVVDPAFDWQGDSPPRTPWSDTVIYECHVKGMTALRPDVPEVDRGTYRGLASPPVLDHLRRLGVTAVTLGRRLRDRGTKYSAVLDSLRHDVAVDLVRSSPLSCADIAFLLGYSAEPSFRRAFRRWEGVTPGRLRPARRPPTRPPAANLAKQQKQLDHFRHRYNFERPHEALDGDFPAERWKAPTQAYSGRPRSPEYPGHFEIRRVCARGAFRLKSGRFFLAKALAGEDLGLEEVDDGIWNIVFYNTLLGRIDRETGTITGNEKV